VRRAQRVSVTFDRPMEATRETARLITSLEPAEDGVWRWLGDRTLVFVPRDGVLPMATPYTVVINAGARAADGSELQDDYTWSFETSRPRLLAVAPGDRRRVRRDTPIVLTFDQRVDPGSTLKATQLVAGGRSQPLRLATMDELAAFPEVAEAAEAGGRHAVALRPIAPLPDGEVATLTVGPGINAFEGPLLSTERQVHALRTLPALAVTRTRCGFGGPCRPGDPWTLELDHPVDEAAFDPAQITVTPALPGLEVTVAGRWITVSGQAHGRTRYTVTVAAGLRDIHGQRLASPATASFDVAAASPELRAPGSTLVALPPGAARALPVTTVNLDALRVSVRRVGPEDWPAWLVFTREAPRAVTPIDPPGELLDTRVVSVRGAADTPIVTALDLSDALPDGRGHLIVSVTPTTEPRIWYQRLDLHRWVDATELSASVWADGDRVRVWVTELATGASVPAAEVRLGGVTGGPVVAATGADGTASLSLATLPREGRSWLVVRKGEDVAIVPDGDTGLGGPSPWLRVAGAERARWLVLDGGAPGVARERWRAQGWVRLVAPRGSDDVMIPPGPGATLRWTIHDARSWRIDRGEAEVDALGGFTIDARLSSRAHAGRATLSLTLERGETTLAEHAYAFAVMDPETATSPPRLSAVPASLASPGEVGLTLAVRPGDEGAADTVRWRASLAPRPAPALAPDGFTFSGPAPGDARVATTRSHLDDEGRAHAVLSVPTGVPTPARVEVRAALASEGEPTREGRTTVALPRTADLAGIRLSRGWARAGEEVAAEIVAVAPSGRPRAGRELTVVATRGAGDDDPVEVCERTSAGLPVRCAWTPEPGAWEVAVTGPNGERATAPLLVFSDPTDAADRLVLVPDQPVHAPGEVARVLVRAPFPTGSGVVTVARDGVLTSERFEVSRGLAELSLPVTARWRPGVVVEAHVVATGDQAPRAHALARTTIAVPPVDRALDVALSVPAGVAPGASLPVTARVTDRVGGPVPGATVVVVATPTAGGDAAVTDPMARFWGSRPSGVVTAIGRDRVIRGDVEASPPDGATSAAPPTDDDEPALPGELVGQASPTDDDGRTRIRWRVPPHEGAFRLDAVAVSGADRFGRGALNVASHDAVTVDVRWPRALLVGDRVDVPIVLHNHGAAGATVALAARVGGMDLPTGAGLRVAVPAKRSVTAALPIAAREPGTHRVAVAWETPSAGRPRLETGEVEVLAATLSRRRQLDGPVPRGGLALTVAPVDAARRATLRVAASEAVTLAGAVTALASQRDADDAETLASRIIAWAALADNGRLVRATGLADEDAVRADLRRDLAALQRLQGDDGGFSGWRRGAPSTPWLSVHAAHAVARAAEAGARPPGELLDRSRRYLAQIDRHLPRSASPGARATLVAYALYVRNLLGDDDVERAKALVAAPDELDLEAAAMLLSVVRRTRSGRGEARQLERRLDAWIDAGAVRLQPAPEDRAVTLATADRALAIALDAMVTNAARSDRTARLAAVTLAARNPSGSFGGDEADAWAIVALSRTFAASERKRPDVTARAWVDGALRLDERLTLRSGAAEPVTTALPAGSGARFALTRRGSGPLHYALVDEGEAPLEAVESGFVVSRRLVAVDDPDDVRRDGDGTWRVRLGARVRVLVTAVTIEDRGRAVLRAPTPPGFLVDPRTALADGERSRDRRGPVWSFDGATRAHLPAIGAGPHVFSYVARATMRGRVTVPGVELRLLSDRAVRGLSAPMTLRVE